MGRWPNSPPGAKSPHCLCSAARPRLSVQANGQQLEWMSKVEQLRFRCPSDPVELGNRSMGGAVRRVAGRPSGSGTCRPDALVGTGSSFSWPNPDLIGFGARAVRTDGQVAALHPFGLALVEIPAPRLVVRDALRSRAKRRLEGLGHLVHRKTSQKAQVASLHNPPE